MTNTELKAAVDSLRPALQSATTTKQERAQFVCDLVREVYDHIKFDLHGPHADTEERARLGELLDAALPAAPIPAAAQESTITHKPSEGADGPLGRVALGMRIEVYDENDNLLGAFLREDVKAAACPRPGDKIAAGTLGDRMHQFAGLWPAVHHVDHYLTIPGVKDWDPMSTIVIHVRNQSREALDSISPEIESQGWSRSRL